MKVEFDPEKHQYKINGIIVPCVSDILGVDSEVFRQAEIRKGLPENYYADRGIEIHLMTQEYDENGIENKDHKWYGYLQAWKKFISDNNVNILCHEMIVASEELKLAGTLDVLAEFNNYLWILDIKSGSFTESHPKQLSCYRKLYEDDSRIIKNRLPEKLGGVYLRPNGRYSFKEFEYDPFEVIYMRKKYG